MDLEMKILSSSSFLRKMEMCLEQKLLWLSIYDQSADREKIHTTLFFFPTFKQPGKASGGDAFTGREHETLLVSCWSGQ